MYTMSANTQLKRVFDELETIEKKITQLRKTLKNHLSAERKRNVRKIGRFTLRNAKSNSPKPPKVKRFQRGRFTLTRAASPSPSPKTKSSKNKTKKTK